MWAILISIKLFILLLYNIKLFVALELQWPFMSTKIDNIERDNSNKLENNSWRNCQHWKYYLAVIMKSSENTMSIVKFVPYEYYDYWPMNTGMAVHKHQMHFCFVSRMKEMHVLDKVVTSISTLKVLTLT